MQNSSAENNWKYLEKMSAILEKNGDSGEEDFHIDNLDIKEPMSTTNGEHIYEYDGVKIHFPYTAYQCQEEMMQEIIKGVENSQNCLLESPTGTGKTAALLCSLLAWQQKQHSNNNSNNNNNSSNLNPESKPPKIYYATKTPAQIKAVVTQLKKTVYSHVPMTILGSREQFCVNPEARRRAEDSSSSPSDTFNKFCEDFHAAAVQENSRSEPDGPFYKSMCPFYLDGDQADFSSLIQGRGAVDIEDLINYGKEHKKCPYYGSRDLIDGANIIFCTYNHLLRRSLRIKMKMGGAHKIQFENSIYVFDEGHNIEGFCTKMGSFEFSLDKVDEVKQILEEAAGKSDIPKIKIEPLNNLKQAFTHLSKWLRDESSESEAGNFEPLPEERKYDRDTGEYVTLKKGRRDLNPANFANFRLNAQTPRKRARFASFPEIMDSALFGPKHLKALWSSYFYMEDEHEMVTSDGTLFKLDKKAVNFVSSLLSTLQDLFKQETKETGQHSNSNFFPRLRDYKIDLYRTVYPCGRVSVKLVLMCVNPGVVFEKMKDCRSVILTSGCLSPMNSFPLELGIPFDRRLIANHVLSRDRVFVSVIDQLKPESPHLQLTYKNYQDQEPRSRQIRDDLGQIVLSICKTVPNGIVVFVESKACLKLIKTHFMETGILKEIEEVKTGGVFWETDLEEQKKRMPEMISEYVKGAKEGEKGAILFAFCRGKISESVVFSDEEARAVIIMGVPFLSRNAEKVKAKMYYNGSRSVGNRIKFDGKDWHRSSAFRALNQAFGNCIRHSKDWGVICLIENGLTNYYSALSNWVKDGINGDRIGCLENILPQIQGFVQQLTTNQ